MLLKVINEIEIRENGIFSSPKVVNRETGEIVDNVMAIQIELSPHGCYAHLTLVPEIDVDVADPEIEVADLSNEDS
jgi:hypothetical protein